MFESVRNAWLNAMKVLDKLIQGTPQDVHNPEVLLGLLSWHLYPDMNVVSGSTRHILQQDPLIQPGGIVTLGLQNSEPKDEEDTGIRWSLPLSHLRYYEKSVLSTGYIKETSSKIAFTQLLFVALGSLTRSWGVFSRDFHELCRFFAALADFVERSPDFRNTSDLETVTMLQKIMKLLRTASNLFLKANDYTRDDAVRLFMLGKRRGASFLNEDGGVSAVFGLSDRKVHYSLLQKNVNLRVSWLRDNLTQESVPKVKLENALLAYDGHALQETRKGQLTTEGTIAVPHSSNAHNHPDHPDFSGQEPEIVGKEFASLQKRWFHIGQTAYFGHRRWIPAFESDGIKRVIQPEDASNHRATNYLSNILKDFSSRQDPRLTSWAIPGHFSVLTAAAERVVESSPLDQYGLYTGSIDKFHSYRHYYEVLKLASSVLKEAPVIPLRKDLGSKPYPCERTVASRKRSGCPEKWYVPSRVEYGPDTLYTCIIGKYFSTQDEVAVLLPNEDMHTTATSADWSSLYGLMAPMELYQIITALNEDHFDGQSLFKHLKSQLRGRERYTFDSLLVLCEACDIYQSLQDAPVDLSIIGKPLHTARWAGYFPSAEKSFACIAMFENGGFSVHPEDLVNVLAVSNKNSLYISEAVLHDPIGRKERGLVRRVVGNLGKPGLLFLTTPKDLAVMEPDYSSWQQVNHRSYDGTTETFFRETSLHLRLTGYEFPLNVRDHGLWDQEVLVVQAVVQAFDRGEWVADIDLNEGAVLSITAGRLDLVPLSMDECQHQSSERSDFSALEPLTSVESWLELLDPPPNNYVIRAKGSWTARQAIAAVLSQRRVPFLLAGEEVCWKCVAGRTLKQYVVVW